jgi:hypothetical protein
MKMAFSQQDLRVKIHKLINTEIALGRIAQLRWIVGRLIENVRVPKKWNGEESEESTLRRDEALIVLWEGYRQFVGQVMRERKQDETANPSQGVLPGFSQLQIAYSIRRLTGELDENGRPIKAESIIPIGLITREEMIAKLRQLIRMRDGLNIHIEEMQRYIDERWPVGGSPLAA